MVLSDFLQKKFKLSKGVLQKTIKISLKNLLVQFLVDKKKYEEGILLLQTWYTQLKDVLNANVCYLELQELDHQREIKPQFEILYAQFLNYQQKYFESIDSLESWYFEKTAVFKQATFQKKQQYQNLNDEATKEFVFAVKKTQKRMKWYEGQEWFTLDYFGFIDPLNIGDYFDYFFPKIQWRYDPEVDYMKVVQIKKYVL
jgi:hypothetical protein